MTKNIDFQITALRQTRKNILKLISAYDLDQLNQIPQGFNNNLLWQAGHVVVTQQLLCYRLAGESVHVSEEMIAKYRKGSKPTEYINEEEKTLIFDLLDKTVDLIAADLHKEMFQNYKPYPTSFGVTLSNIDEALTFNLAHETMHLGNMLAMKRLV